MVAIDEELLEAGLRVVRRHGYAGATAERIAQEAGLSRVTLHRRGVAKDAILGALAERAIARYRELMWPALTASGSGAQRLEQGLRAVCAGAEEHLELLLALRAQSDAVFHEPAAPDEHVETRPEFTDALERLLRDGMADGSLAQSDPQRTATLLFNAVGWTYLHLRSGHRWSPQEAEEQTVRLVLDGLRA